MLAQNNERNNSDDISYVNILIIMYELESKSVFHPDGLGGEFMSEKFQIPQNQQGRIYSFIKSQVTLLHMFTIKVHVIRNTAHRSSTQASYTIGSGTTMQENQLAAQIAAEDSIFLQMVPYMS